MKPLIPNGPQIPEEIKQALRNDRLVFFCGAGVSAQNGLPLFKELVEKVCENLRIDIDKVSLLKEAKETKSYDGILDMAEGNQIFSVERKDLRKEVIRILSQTQGKPDIHKSLLELSALPDGGGHRLVTTNFDRLFFKAGLDPGAVDAAPKLAPPRKETWKKGTWKNLTFLHGVIDKKNDPEGNNLVLTRKDFGRAYLLDNWAARFVIQLFQDWTVLFIGYSASDPVMNYLLSAISYENQRRKEERRKENLKAPGIKDEKIKPSIYAFAGHEEGKEGETKNKWRSIGIEPILYRKQDEDHSLLYETIKRWAVLEKAGLEGRKHWLKEQLKGLYKETGREEKDQTFISSLKIDEEMAEHFPQINYSERADLKKFKPVDISWLKAFSESKDLEKESPGNKSRLFPGLKNQDKKNLLEKLISRTKETQSGHSILWEPLSHFEIAAAKWLLRHLDKKELIQWLIDKSPQGIISLHPEFKRMIDLELRIIKNPEEALGERPFLFWQILISQKDHLKNKGIGFGGNFLMHDINKSYSREKMQRLLHVLEPYIMFEKYFYSKKILKLEGQPDVDKVYEPKLMIDMEHYPSSKTKIKKEDVLLRHAEDFSNLLKKAMELARFSGIIQENGEDPFFIHRPSIAPSIQNNNFESWLYLIKLARESFDLAMKKDRSLADFLLSKWQRYPFSLFRRLILYAVTKHNELDEKTALDLFEKNPAVLWSITCQYEVLNYLQKRAHSKKAAKTLLDLIFKGPARSLFKKDVNEKEFNKYKEIEIWEKLSDIKISGIQLPEDMEKFYQEVQSKHSLRPKTKDDDSRKFPFYMTKPRLLGSERRYHKLTNEEIFNDIKYTKPDALPDTQIKREDFRQFVKEIPEGIERGFEILSMFKDNDLNSTPFWSGFLSEVSMSSAAKEGNEYFLKSLKKIENFDNKFMKECLWSLIHGLREKAGPVYTQEGRDYFKKWWLRLWQLSAEDNEDSEKESDFSFQALNSNFGKLSRIIFVLWRKFPDSKAPKDGKIPDEVKEYFEIMIQGGKEKDPSALFNFGLYLWNLWHLDREWTMENLKPLMAWKTNSRACQALWEGYSHRMLLNPNFAVDFKREFFQLLLNGKEFYKKKEGGERGAEYQSALAEIFFILTGGKWMPNIFEENEIKEIIRAFDDASLWEELARKIWLQLKDSEKGKSSALWSETIRPWIDNFWPPQTKIKTPETAKYLSLAALNCEDKFPEALEFLKDKIDDVSSLNQNDILYQIKEKNKSADVFKNHPKELLQLLIWNFPEEKIDYLYDEKMKKILDGIKAKHPEIEKDTNYKKLQEKLHD